MDLDSRQCCPIGSFGDPYDFTCKLPLQFTIEGGSRLIIPLDI